MIKRVIKTEENTEVQSENIEATSQVINEDDEQLEDEDEIINDEDAEVEASEEEVADEEEPAEETTEEGPTVQDMVNSISQSLVDIKKALGMTTVATEIDSTEDGPALGESTINEEEDDADETVDESADEELDESAVKAAATREAAIAKGNAARQEESAFAKDLSDKLDGFGFKGKNLPDQPAAKKIDFGVTFKKVGNAELAAGTDKSKDVCRWGKDSTCLSQKKDKDGLVDKDVQAYIDSLKGAKQVEAILNSFRK